MTITGYSDRINHALAFAAKHHDQQVRKGTRLPYLTHPANVAIVLTRYQRDDQTVVAGILHDVIEDCVREAYTRQMLEQRIGDKFGADVLDTVLAVTQRRLDDDGVELSYDERRDDYLERLSLAGDAARWVCAADALHNAATLLADLRRTIDPDTVWRRFTANREDTARWYRRILDRLRSVGFQGEILRELDHVVVALEAWARDEGTREESSNRYTGAAEA
ncbi:MAG TPA: HD domain-containing protein [Gemmatimonadaceae bacterium]|nr:HD domain-containing protein [Gemmatimonadaceae bacterium]